MKPLYERILIKPIEKETQTKSGILLPGKAVKRPNIGTVIACGEGTTHNPMKVEPGERRKIENVIKKINEEEHSIQ